MTRSDNASWDIATSVGATAVMVAMVRAAGWLGFLSSHCVLLSRERSSRSP
jgi:hypothetical protein